MAQGEKYSLYNAYLPNNKHAPRLQMKIEDIFVQVDGNPIADHVKYLVLGLGGTIKESGDDFQMPPIKYVFRE